jgi:hypothetical protein
MIDPILAAAGGTAAGAIVPIVMSAIARKLKDRADLPEKHTKEIAELAKRTTRLEGGMVLLVDLQDIELTALDALLESQQGKCNGNVEKALLIVGEGRQKYQTYLKEGKQ